MGSSDFVQNLYTDQRGVLIVTYFLENGNQYRARGFRDNGNSVTQLWDIPVGGKVSFGPGNEIYFIQGNRISAYSEGERGNPEGLAMGFINDRAPNPPFNPSPQNNSQGIGNSVTLSWFGADV